MTQLANTEPTLRLNFPKTSRVLTGWAGGTLRKGDAVSAARGPVLGTSTIGDGGYFEINLSEHMDFNNLQRPIIVTATDATGKTASASTGDQIRGRPYVTDGSPAAAV